MTLRTQPLVRQTVTGEDPDAAVPLPKPEEFRDGKGYATDYKPAPELTELVIGLVEEHPNDYGALRQFRWEILWAKTLGKVGEDPRVFKVEKLRGLAKHYAPHHAVLVIAIARDACAAMEVTRFQLEHWVAMALESIDVNEEGEARVLPRLDAERAAVLIERYGVQTRYQQRLAEALANLQPQQLSFLDGAGREEEPEEGAADRVPASAGGATIPVERWGGVQAYQAGVLR